MVFLHAACHQILQNAPPLTRKVLTTTVLKCTAKISSIQQCALQSSPDRQTTHCGLPALASPAADLEPCAFTATGPSLIASLLAMRASSSPSPSASVSLGLFFLLFESVDLDCFSASLRLGAPGFLPLTDRLPVRAALASASSSSPLLDAASSSLEGAWRWQDSNERLHLELTTGGPEA